MSATRLIRCYEYDRLKAGQAYNDEVFTSEDLEALQRIHEDQNLYFDLIHNGIRFKNYVGVLHIRRLTIEILPKADNHPGQTDIAKAGWSKLLMEMLRISGLSKVGSIGKAHQRLRNNTLLDLYIQHFLNECDEMMRRGLIKAYRRKRENIGVLKGQLIFPAHLRENLIRRDKFYTDHQTYDQGHLVNHILLAALEVVDRIATDATIKATTRRLLMQFPELPPRPAIHASTFDRIIMTRKLAHYEESLGLAKLILLNFSPDLQRGRDDVLAILFDMNVLWERFIYRTLQKSLGHTGCHVSYQNSKEFWNKRRVKPDIVLTLPSGEEVVIDTKWKLIRDGKPSDADLKQMFVYNLYWRTDRSILLYPGDETWSGNWGKFYEGKPRPQVDDADIYHYCKVSTLKIWDDHQGHPSLSHSIAENILEFTH